MMKFNEFQKYEATLHIPYEKYFELIYETKYLIEARLGPDRQFVAYKSFYGCNRRSAVIKASEWYNSHLKKVLGNPQNIMFIDDPLLEVTYDDDFVCTDLRNKYLDENTITRLLAEAQGDLGRENSILPDGAPLGSVKRLRKRKRKEVQLTDRLSQTPGGTIYYKMTEVVEGRGCSVKVRKIKLASKSLLKAKREVIRRGLNKFEKFSENKLIPSRKFSSIIQAA
jgi:hypothetical protein